MANVIPSCRNADIDDDLDLTDALNGRLAEILTNDKNYSSLVGLVDSFPPAHPTHFFFYFFSFLFNSFFYHYSSSLSRFGSWGGIKRSLPVNADVSSRTSPWHFFPIKEE